jgi:hypothetical protein
VAVWVSEGAKDRHPASGPIESAQPQQPEGLRDAPTGVLCNRHTARCVRIIEVIRSADGGGQRRTSQGPLLRVAHVDGVGIGLKPVTNQVMR